MPNAKRTYTVTVDGREFSRSSHNVYTHYIVCAFSTGSVVDGWSGSHENAMKAMRQKQAAWPQYHYEVRAIEETAWTEEDGVITIDIGG